MGGFPQDAHLNKKPAEEVREAYLVAHPQPDARIRGLISSGIVGVGMSREQVAAAWGKPDKITLEKDLEVWSYWDNPKFHPRVYFKDGIVVKTE